MNVSEVLNRAADLIEERGWTQGPEGWGCGPHLCLEGGLAGGLGEEGEIAPNTDVYTSDAYEAVAAYLDLVPIPRTAPIKDALWCWNDADGRTAAEVIETLRAAAIIAAAAETDVTVVAPEPVSA